jgi:hypothetical protein
VTNENITARTQEFLPVAVFVFFVSYVAFEVIHLIHSPGWKWKRTAKGCSEALAFLVLSMPITVGASFFASLIAGRFGFGALEEAAIMRYLAFLVLIPLLVIWNGHRWRTLKRTKSAKVDLV